MYGVGCCCAGAHRESPLDEPGAKETVVIEVVYHRTEFPLNLPRPVLYCFPVFGNYAVTCSLR